MCTQKLRTIEVTKSSTNLTLKYQLEDNSINLAAHELFAIIDASWFTITKAEQINWFLNGAFMEKLFVKVIWT